MCGVLGGKADDQRSVHSGVTAQPGRVPKQAPRYPVAVLESLEALILEGAAFLPKALLIGSDKTLSHRLVVISERCYVRKRDWISCGWRLLSAKRDYLLQMPSRNLKGCLHRELRYDTAYALQRRVMDARTSGQEKLFTHGVSHFWTPHPGRNFLPSAAAALNVETSDRDMLGGWMAQEGGRKNRVAKVRIQVVRNLVAASFADRANSDRLLETDALEEFSLSNGKVQAKNSMQRISRSCRVGVLLSSHGPQRNLRRERPRGWTREKCNNVRKRRRGNEKRRRRQKVGKKACAERRQHLQSGQRSP